jgi:hypothetical protein
VRRGQYCRIHKIDYWSLAPKEIKKRREKEET